VFCSLASERVPEGRAAVEAWRKWYESQHELAGDTWAPLVREPVVWWGQLSIWEPKLFRYV
jgi:hypothetical protein